MTEIESRINSFCKELGLSNLNKSAYTILDWGNISSTTVLFDKKQYDAIQLEPVMAVPIKYVLATEPKYPEDFTGTLGIHRFMVSIGGISRSDSLGKFTEMITPLVNQAKVDLINRLGCLDRLDIRLTMELTEGIYIRLSDNYSGYEFRVTAIKG